MMIRKSYLFSGTIALATIVFIILTTRSEAISLFSSSDLTPTAIPPDVLTRIAQDEANISATQTAYPPIATKFIQTEEALHLTLAVAPSEDMQIAYPILNNAPPRIEEILSFKPEGILAGDGILYEEQLSGVFHKYLPNSWIWQKSTHDSVIWVRGGYLIASPTQGIVHVSIVTNSYNSDVVIESPVQAGELTITGAIGERLTLTSAQGQTFYFDVPGLRFVSSLDEIIPTTTPPPTMVFEPPFVPIDDSLDEPVYLYDFQLEDSELNYYINSPNDYDWFAFVSQAEGTLKVSLNTRGKNYGLRMVLVDFDGNGTIVGEDITLGSGAKQVIVPHADRGNYMVRVWSLDGSYDEGQPYTLRFEPPKPELITPILECVADNADGTFTAHFGYENPNLYVVSFFEERDNSFGPEPIFRAGQPQYFVPGRVEDWFRVLFDGNDLIWKLNGLEITANRNSPKCP